MTVVGKPLEENASLTDLLIKAVYGFQRICSLKQNFECHEVWQKLCFGEDVFTGPLKTTVHKTEEKHTQNAQGKKPKFQNPAWTYHCELKPTVLN